MAKIVRRLLAFLPSGGTLPEQVWREGHRLLLGLTWFHAVLITLVGPVLGYSWELSIEALFEDGTVLHTVGEGLIVAFFAALAGRKGTHRAFQATAVGFGLMSSSAILVHLSGGYIELHFHFFVMLGFLALYQDWIPYLLAIVYVALHHGVVGVLWPEEVFNHTAAFNAPWSWAGIHAFFVLWACVGSVLAWRFNETALAWTKLILNSAGEGVYGVDLDGKAAFVNSAAATMLGYEPEELVGKSLHEVVHHSRPDGTPYPREECPIYAASKDGTVHRVTDEVFWRKDGTSFWVEYVSTPIIERRRLTGAVLTFADITERKQLEATRQALHRAGLQVQEALTLQERLSRLMQTAQEVLKLERVNVLLADPQGRWLQAVASLGTGQPLEEIRVPIGPEGGSLARTFLTGQAVVWNSQGPVPEELRLKPPYDRIEAFRSRVFANIPLVVHGRPIGVIGADRKKSRRPFEPGLLDLLQLFGGQAALAIEQARLYEALAQQSALLQATLDSITQGISAFDKDLRLIAWNQRYFELRDLPPALARRGTPFADLIRYNAARGDYGPGDPEEQVAQRLALARSSEPLSFERTRPNGTVIEVRRNPMPVGGFVTTLTDITERKQADQMKSDFVSFVTHQLRTPLSGIKWMLELAVQDEGLSPEARSYVTDAQAAGERLIRLVNDLLDISRLERGKLTIVPQETRLEELTQCVVDELATLIAEKGHHVSVTAAENLPPVWVDPQLLQQVILNLTSNAIKYTPPGGEIAIRMGREDAAVCWAVQDSGIGIPKAAHDRLFEKFYRADNVYTIETEGTGLGLYLVRLILDQLEGRVRCESEEGRGATFTFTLPLRKGG